MKEQIQIWLSDFVTNIKIVIPFFILGIVISYIFFDKAFIPAKNATIEILKVSLESSNGEIKRLKDRLVELENYLKTCKKWNGNTPNSKETVSKYNSQQEKFITPFTFVPFNNESIILISEEAKYDTTLKLISFDRWAYVWSDHKVIDFSRFQSFKVSFTLKYILNRDFDEQLLSKYDAALQFFICEGLRIKKDEGRLSLLGNRLHLKISVIENPITIKDAGFRIGETTKNGNEILHFNQWHKVEFNFTKSHVNISVDGSEIISSNLTNFPQKAYYLRFESWNHAAKFMLKDIKIIAN